MSSSGSDPGRRDSKSISRAAILGCALVTLFFALYPVTRSFFRGEVDYNEGWNIYNARLVVQHQQLYPVAYGWETVNYPIGSFELMAFLHRFTHEYLFTARAVSLISLAACCWLAGLIVRCLTRTARAGILAGLFCFATFCTCANAYVGMDDPQLLAQAFFMLAFFLYIRSRKSFANVTVVAAILVLAGSIKHNPLDFPLAILIDLLLISGRRALWFVLSGVGFAAVSLWLNTRFGGPFFVSQMLAPRIWTMGKLADTSLQALGPMLIPILAAALVAWRVRLNPRQRPLGLLLVTSVAVGLLFSGGAGVWVNTYFSAYLAIALLLGVGVTLPGRVRPELLAGAAFAWLVIPAVVAGVGNPVRMLRETVARQSSFDQSVAFLRQQSSPELCENLLQCYAAGQPYVYDPFNATRLVAFGKLDPRWIVDGLNHHVYGAIELEKHDPGDTVQSERFPQAVMQAIRANYVPALEEPDTMVLVPRK